MLVFPRGGTEEEEEEVEKEANAWTCWWWVVEAAQVAAVVDAGEAEEDEASDLTAWREEGRPARLKAAASIF